VVVLGVLWVVWVGVLVGFVCVGVGGFSVGCLGVFFRLGFIVLCFLVFFWGCWFFGVDGLVCVWGCLWLVFLFWFFCVWFCVFFGGFLYVLNGGFCLKSGISANPYLV